MTAPYVLMGELLDASRALDAAIAAAPDTLAASLARVASGGEVEEEDFQAAFAWALRGRDAVRARAAACMVAGLAPTADLAVSDAVYGDVLLRAELGRNRRNRKGSRPCPRPPCEASSGACASSASVRVRRALRGLRDDAAGARLGHAAARGARDAAPALRGAVRAGEAG